MADDRMHLASSDQFVGMTRSDPVMELVWENGQVLVRGHSGSQSCDSCPPSSLKFQAYDQGMFSEKTRRLDHYSAQEYDGSLRHDEDTGLFPGLNQADFNLFFQNTGNFDGVDSQVVPVCKTATSRNVSRFMAEHPQIITVPELQNQDEEYDRQRLGMKSYSVPETLTNKANVVKSFKNQAECHTTSSKMKFVDAEPTQKLPFYEQPQGDGHKSSTFRYCPDTVLVPVPVSSAAKDLKERSRDQMVVTTSMCSRASNDMVCSSPRRRHEDNDLSSSPSNNVEEEKTSSYLEACRQRGCCKRKRSTEVHNFSEKKRRAKINKKMRELQELIPNSDKVDKASMLDQAIEYLKTLQLQVQLMQMARSLCTQSIMLPGAMQAPQFGHLFASLGTGMHMGSFGCDPAMFTASSMLGMPGQMLPMTLSPTPFMPFMGGSSGNSFVALPHSIPGMATPADFLASASLLSSRVSARDSDSGNNGNVLCSKIHTSRRR